MEFYQELLPLEAEFADLGPGERVDLGAVLEDENPEVGHGKVQGDTLMVLGKCQYFIPGQTVLSHSTGFCICHIYM